MSDAAKKQRPFLLKPPPPPRESDEQMHLARWLDFKGHLWNHVPNGEARDARTGAKLKRMGVKPGVPDIMIYDRPPGPQFKHARGVAVELKTRYGSVSDKQKAWHHRLEQAGWLVKVCRSSKEAIGWLQSLGF